MCTSRACVTGDTTRQIAFRVSDLRHVVIINSSQQPIFDELMAVPAGYCPKGSNPLVLNVVPYALRFSVAKDAGSVQTGGTVRIRFNGQVSAASLGDPAQVRSCC
jgi:hypothetical protein